MAPARKKIDPDSFFLCRIIGNDLVPRHRPGQARANVRFILENEHSFEGCQKFWIVNRIVDDAERDAIVRLLDEHQQSYTITPFDREAYAKAVLDTSRVPPGFDNLDTLRNFNPRQKLAMMAALLTHKINAAINVNGARNAALMLGRSKAAWILPWDGNCFLTRSAWQQIRDVVLRRSRLPYFIVPMARVVENGMLLDDGYFPEPSEEPQIVFRNDAREKFDERYPYGHLDKAELLLRLNVPGQWDNWTRASWSLPRPKPCGEAGKFAAAGWVARLSSGQPEQEGGRSGFQQRVEARHQALVDFIDHLDTFANGVPDQRKA